MHMYTPPQLIYTSISFQAFLSCMIHVQRDISHLPMIWQIHLPKVTPIFFQRWTQHINPNFANTTNQISVQFSLWGLVLVLLHLAWLNSLGPHFYTPSGLDSVCSPSLIFTFREGVLIQGIPIWWSSHSICLDCLHQGPYKNLAYLILVGVLSTNPII